LRKEIQELRQQKMDLDEFVILYTEKADEWKKNKGRSHDDSEAETEKQKFLEDHRELLTEYRLIIELIDTTIEYKNEKLCGNHVSYDENIETNSLALQKLCKLDIGETRNLIYKMFRPHVGLLMQLEDLDKRIERWERFYDYWLKEKSDYEHKLREQNRIFRKAFDVQKRDYEKKFQLLLKSQNNSTGNGSGGLTDDVQAAFEREIQKLKEELKRTKEEGQQHKRFFKDHQNCSTGCERYTSNRVSKRSGRQSHSHRRRSSDRSSKNQTNSAEDGNGSASSDISALDPSLVERFQRHVRKTQEENRVPNNSITIQQKKHGKNRLIIKSADVD